MVGLGVADRGFEGASAAELAPRGRRQPAPRDHHLARARVIVASVAAVDVDPRRRDAACPDHLIARPLLFSLDAACCA